MNTDNVYLVILLVVGIVVLSNLAMFAFVRGWREIKIDWLKQLGAGGRPTGEGRTSMDELHRRVQALEGGKVEDENLHDGPR